jgi:two-component system response regulator DesR
MIRIVIADDEQLLRTALSALLALENDISVVGEAANGEEAVRIATGTPVDVVLLDLEMPVLGGVDAAQRLAQDLPGVPVVILTRHARPGTLQEALRVGVMGFVSKAVDAPELATIVRRVHAGKRYIDPDVSRAAFMSDSPLSPREQQVLRHAVKGASVREISVQLHLAPGTVRNHLSRVMAKTGTVNRHAAVHVATDRGWI